MTKVEELREMVSSELLHMLADVANREIPTQVAYAEIQKRLAASHAEGVASVKGEDGIAHCHEYTEKGFWDDATKHDDLDLVKEAR
jgi:hypothetical protein